MTGASEIVTEKHADLLWSGGDTGFARICAAGGGLLICSSAVWLFLLWASEGHDLRSSVLCGGNFLLGIYCFVEAQRLRIWITSSYIEMRVIRARRIYFTDVKSVSLSVLGVQIHGGSRMNTIRMSVGLAERHKALDILMSQLQRYEDIKVTGDKALLKRYNYC